MIIRNNKVLKEVDFVNEKELQSYFEKNIESILSFKFVATEFSVGSFRIDTLAFDEEAMAFKIIEYKNVKNHSLVDQGYTYLKLMLERKADFVLQYNLKNGSNLSINDVDWSQSRIIFVSPVFTPYQLNATDFKNIPVDLYKVTKYEDDIVDIDLIQKTSNVKIEEVKMNYSNDAVANEIKVYTEEDHFARGSNELKIVYETLKEKVLQLDDIDVDVRKICISFKGSKNIIDVEFYRSFIQISVNMKKGTLDDPNGIMSCYITDDGKKIGHHGAGDYYISIRHTSEIDQLIPIIRQSLSINKK